MKILFLNYEYPPLGGGAANATAYLLSEWSQDEAVEVHLVTSGIGQQFEETKIGNNVFVHRLPIGKNPNNLHHQSLLDLVTYSVKAWWFGRRLIKKEHFNVTLAFFGVPCGFLALLLKWEYSVPYAVALRGSDVPGYSRKYTWLYPILSPLIGWIWKQAVAVIPNSRGLAELAKKSLPQQEFTVIENGVDTKQFFPDTSKRPSSEFILTPGASRITERKGLDYLIEAVALLAPEYPELRLKIMGDGNARPKLEALVKEKGLEEKVKFLGRIPREETAPYYQEASLFVMPSLNEGMSNAMLEALASGLPIVSTPTGGAAELISEGKNGILIEEKSAESIAAAIEIFLKDNQLVAQYGTESRTRAEAQDWNRVAENFKKTLENSIKK